MSVRLIIDGNEVYEIDEECECFKAAVEEQQARQNRRGCQRPPQQPMNQPSPNTQNPSSQQGTQNWNNTRKW